MADCKDIDKALNNLSGKIDNFNNKLKDLDNRVKKAESCCDNKLKQEEGKKEQDLSALMARMAKLEAFVQAIYDYLVKGIKPIVDIVKGFTL